MTEVAADRLKSALADRYAIERQIGQGGMATVYLARDLRHHRHVALKVLRPELAAVIGADRFLHEIRVTASLQHPHILPLHDSGEADTFLYYVMPFVDGESLRERLKQERQLPIDEAVRIASEVAAALSYAHGRGVIHRDIKPENVLLASGSAVVADFGIARAVSEAGEGRLTETGLSLGTPQYMSPEQATAERDLDARTDIYALGAVVYEMLVGEPPYTGPTTQSVIAKVLTEAPRSMRILRPTVPDHIDLAVQRALAKLPADRFRSATEFSTALERAAPTRTAAAPVPSSAATRSRTRSLAAGVTTVAAVAFGISGWLRRPAASPEPVVRSMIHLPDEARVEGRRVGSPLALSPDGSVLVYSGRRQLFMRRLDKAVAVPIPNTLGAEQPFFSPDGRDVGFVAEGALKRVPLAGGPVVTICTAEQVQGATWGDGNIIVFAGGATTRGGMLGGMLFRVSADGGTPAPIVRDSIAPGMRWPDFIPGTNRVLASLGTALQNRTAVIDLETGRVDSLPGAAWNPHFVKPGWLVSISIGGTVFALPFDPRAARVTGPAVTVVEGVGMRLPGVASFAVSRNGWLIYAEGVARQRRLALVDRRGKQTLIPVDAQPYSDPRFSPNGNDVAVTVLRSGGGLLGDIWIGNLPSATMSRLTFEGTDQFPEWSNDGRHVVFTTLPDTNGVYWRPVGGGAPEPVMKDSRSPVYEATLSHDGKRIVYRLGPVPNGDLYYVHRDSLGTPHSLVTSRFDERAATISPDDRWVAYVSDETGRDEVYVRPFPDGAGHWVISAAGGREPRWSHDQKELFYRNADTLFAVQIQTRGGFSVGQRTRLFSGSFVANSRHAAYDVHPDDQRFIFITGDDIDPGELTLVQNALAAAARPR